MGFFVAIFFLSKEKIILYLQPMRGIRSNYLSLFDSPAPAIKETPERRGRSEVLFQKQTDFIIYRHYFFIKICGRQYHISLQDLERETFIAERTIINRFQGSHSKMRQVFIDKPTVKDLKDKYPHVNWQC